MVFALECMKARRTGILPAFIGAGMLAAAIPIVNMAFRWEIYVGQPEPPIAVLLKANWKLMAMLNLFLLLSSACILYHTEYADGALQHLRALPLREGRLFFGKLGLMVVLCLPLLALEMAAVAFCSAHWFGQLDLLPLLESFGYALLLLLPAAACCLLIAGCCKSMWVSLGAGVICIFIASMLPQNSFFLSLFPFALPFRMWTELPAKTASYLAYAAAAELLPLFIIQLSLVPIRRVFS